MAVKVLVARQVSEDHLKAVMELLDHMRLVASRQPGYLLGETLNPLPRSDELLVLSTWQTIEDWNRWFENPLRMRLQKEIDLLSTGRTEYTLYRDI